ncbi:glycosyltransferase family 4 protein [Neorhizobium sp. NPDC001467]|uniref:glycosyltransferase family 4 protein n=1 Tax=Neorhizobium sp. NPDC001467 TaxID=3390595 RepID=UPI003D050A6E
MRTALLAWDYPPSPSGLSTAAREIAQALAGEGCDVTVFTLDRTGTKMVDGVRVIGCAIDGNAGLARLRKWAAVGHLAAPVQFRRAVLREHARQPFAVVEATNWYAPAALLTGRHGFALVTRNSTPAAWSRSKDLTLRNRIDAHAADWLEARQAAGSAGLISNTDDHGRRIVDLYRIGSRVPHRTVGLSLPPDLLDVASASPYPDEDAPVRILFIGRAESRKGFAELMGAAELLASEVRTGAVPAFHLDLLGVPAADLPETLSAAARNHVTAWGRMPDETLHDLYRRAHVIAAPSRYESFGLVYQEAIAFGRPVVASAEDPSAREFIGSTGAGILARQTTPSDIADALRNLIQSREMRAGARSRALEAAGRFNRPYLARETLDLYRQALAAMRAGR